MDSSVFVALGIVNAVLIAGGIYILGDLRHRIIRLENFMMHGQRERVS